MLAFDLMNAEESPADDFENPPVIFIDNEDAPDQYPMPDLAPIPPMPEYPDSPAQPSEEGYETDEGQIF